MLYNGDCIEIMQQLVAQNIKVDAIICDPPYGTTACQWDEIIPFDEMWNCLNKITKENSPVVLFGTQPFTTKLIMSNFNNYRESLVWLKNKPASGFRCEQVHMKIHEDIAVFSNNPKYTFNPQKWLISEKEFITQRKTFKENEFIGNNIYGKTTRTRKEDTGERNPISVLSCRVPFTPQKNKEYSLDVDLRYHPTQKPLELMKYLVETYSNEGDIILDFAMGSGTTGCACKELKRNFIGIELNKEYFDIAEKRIKEHKGDLRRSLI